MLAKVIQFRLIELGREFQVSTIFEIFQGSTQTWDDCIGFRTLHYNSLETLKTSLKFRDDGGFVEQIVVLVGRGRVGMEDGAEEIIDVVRLDNTAGFPDLDNIAVIYIPFVLLVRAVDDADSLDVGCETSAIYSPAKIFKECILFGIIFES